MPKIHFQQHTACCRLDTCNFFVWNCIVRSIVCHACLYASCCLRNENVENLVSLFPFTSLEYLFMWMCVCNDHGNFRKSSNVFWLCLSLFKFMFTVVWLFWWFSVRCKILYVFQMIIPIFKSSMHTLLFACRVVLFVLIWLLLLLLLFLWFYLRWSLYNFS